MDGITLIVCLFIFVVFLLLTINHLFNNFMLIDRDWWDKDFKRNGKTTFKSWIKAILLALLLNGFGYLILYLMVGVMGLNPLFFIIPLVLFFSNFVRSDRQTMKRLLLPLLATICINGN